MAQRRKTQRKLVSVEFPLALDGKRVRSRVHPVPADPPRGHPLCQVFLGWRGRRLSVAKPTSTKRPRFCQIRGFQRDREVPRKRAQCGGGGELRAGGLNVPAAARSRVPSCSRQQWQPRWDICPGKLVLNYREKKKNQTPKGEMLARARHADLSVSF